MTKLSDNLADTSKNGRAGGDYGPPSLDGYDRAIIRALAADGRMTMASLAAEVGLSKTPVQARVRRLQEIGVITGYRAVISARRLGLGHLAYVEVRLDDTRESALLAFNKAVQEVPEIRACHMIAGGFDYLLKVRTADMAAYRKVLGEQISALPHVASTSTYVVMEAVKDDADDAGI